MSKGMTLSYTLTHIYTERSVGHPRRLFKESFLKEYRERKNIQKFEQSEVLMNDFVMWISLFLIHACIK